MMMVRMSTLPPSLPTTAESSCQSCWKLQTSCASGLFHLNGPAAENKGMALFPRKVNGSYAMLSRQDNENIFLMCSDNVHFWNERRLLLKPTFPWELVQIGNCGPPIETETGWLVLSHGVGPMRQYCIGAFLLDLEQPHKVHRPPARTHHHSPGEANVKDMCPTWCIPVARCCTRASCSFLMAWPITLRASPRCLCAKCWRLCASGFR